MISIFSNNCIAGFLYCDYKIKFLSPTINLQLTPVDFIKMCSHLDYYLSLEIKEIKVDDKVLSKFKDVGGGNNINFPVGMLGDLMIFFQHYKNINEAIEKWNYRKNRIVKKKYIIMNYINYEAYPCHKDFQEIIAMFKEVPYEKKIFLHSIENLNINKDFVFIPKVKTSWFKQIAYKPYNIKTYQIFNFSRWFNLDNITNSNSTQLGQLQSKLSFQTKYGTAKTRIQNQLSYKLGQTMIINSKNIFGVLFMPAYIISTLLSHRQEKKIYQEKIKKDPSLKLPSLENYPDYKEALKEKECFTYKLGEALIRANNNWYGGGISNCCLRLGS
ncbi:DUF1919 domain-containing protein [Campylobacter coli]|uniref:DUF1919 domain-containing protein n=1 Tax=Campylobacter coli TaxID=195 RepID=UPI0018117F41|nr:DUF1919 domain-containing protein [Campylobacter coli]EEC5816192.1 DUF1919 domain-containing protein [Campylobacter coli]